MTPHYFGSSTNAAGPSIAGLHEQHTASSRRSIPPASAAWHTPSPSAALSVPSPPANAYSPRHPYSNSPAASGPSYIPPPTDDGYHRRPPARQNSGNSSGNGRPILPAPSNMSPARQSAYPPHWPTATVSNPNTPAGVARLHALPAAYRSSSYGGANTDVDTAYARSLANRRADEYGHGGYAAAGVSSSYAHPSQYPSSPSPYGSGSVRSPRARAGQSPRESVHEQAYSRSVERVGSATRSSSQASADRSKPSQGCAPAKKCCPPRDASSVVDSKANASRSNSSFVSNGHKPESNGATENGQRHHATGEPKEDDCCFGFVECDAEVDKPAPAPAPAPAPQVLGTAMEVGLDGLKLKGDECCFGLVKCDTEGRIIM